MRVRILTSIATPARAFRRNQIVSLDDATAADWIGRGMAAPVDPEPVETAEAPAVETAARPHRRRRR